MVLYYRIWLDSISRNDSTKEKIDRILKKVDLDTEKEYLTDNLYHAIVKYNEAVDEEYECWIEENSTLHDYENAMF